VIAYALIFGVLPFNHKDEQENYKNDYQHSSSFRDEVQEVSELEKPRISSMQLFV